MAAPETVFIEPSRHSHFSQEKMAPQADIPQNPYLLKMRNSLPKSTEKLNTPYSLRQFPSRLRNGRIMGGSIRTARDSQSYSIMTVAFSYNSGSLS